MENVNHEIIHNAASGDISAFEEIYKTYGGFVYTLALKVTRNTHDAEEITQEVFLKIYSHLRGFRFRSSFKTWVYRIAINTSFNYLRKHKKEKQQVVHVEDIQQIPTKEIEPDYTNEKREEISRALLTLNLQQKTCILLREIEGLSYQEISQALKIPINTVRSRIKRARQALLAYGQRGIKDYAV